MNITHILSLIFLINLIILGIVQGQVPDKIEYASCQLQSIGTNKINGYVLFSDYSGTSTKLYNVYLVASGLDAQATSVFATVRQYGDLQNTANPVFGFDGKNPYDCATAPGCIGSADVKASEIDWTADFTNGLFNLSPGLKSIIGRTFAISTSESDPKDIIAQCVLGIGNPKFIPADSPLIAVKDATNQAAISDIEGNAIENGAVCYLQPTKDFPTVNGSILITEVKSAKEGSKRGNGINIIAWVNGAPNTKPALGISINQFGDAMTDDGSSCGDIWGLANQTHGLASNNTRLYGDIGNICMYYNDVATYNWTTPYIGYFDTIPNLLGRSIVVRSQLYTANPTYSGSIMATCIIGLREGTAIPSTNLQVNIYNAPPTCLPTPDTNTTSSGDNNSTSSHDSGSFSSITTPIIKITVILSVLSIILF
ncbi:hypothetical protein PPL_11798 [Heterostelium album PN500]|uniref:Superoxide dismutase copper/zinc binding domain-containing protein n=1 Tax=Heterostelium pallidum (strain ATCC 26659 / Pp 5 / PN500) TaxID=670386 RepID=D3BUH8_HETP5|nr:hypothetical protein PPL_11798 [Heterostelium album PN500]EFA74766.1 hypothetical protein PPL_11798 [Heterostelium album PN500]|eukprot:XP_020426900.1 hypothetical protein PPL_11798 [Heterostelium album PN500]